MMKVSELKAIQLNEWVAKAQGYKTVVIDSKVTAFKGSGIENLEDLITDYDPLRNGQQCFALIENFIVGNEGNSAWAWANDVCIGMVGETPNEAICRAVVAKVYGMEVSGD